MDTTSRGTSDEPEGINPPAAPAALELAVSEATNSATVVAKLPPTAAYEALWTALRQKHGLPATLSAAEAHKAAEILLRRQALMGVIRNIRGTKSRLFSRDDKDQSGINAASVFLQSTGIGPQGKHAIAAKALAE